MDRPGLQALLADVEAGLIDMIVVYKIDRLTRSLADFAQIAARLEARGASFTSVTQSFNTATSMGRLTLNMLLSFAQFEREVTAERIRDKIAASKTRGLWMGGTVPLGYEPSPDRAARTLAVNPPEAAQIRRIFELYDRLGCLSAVRSEARREGIRSKARRPGSEGLEIGATQLHRLLTNPLYIGKIRHKNKVFDGRREPIIAPELWARVQEKLTSGAPFGRGQSRAESPQSAPLKGRIFDETGDRLTSTHTLKASRILRYYISNRLMRGADPAGWRLPAAGFERQIAGLLRARIAEQNPFDTAGDDLSDAELLARVSRIDLAPGEVRIALSGQGEGAAFTAPITLRRRGVGRGVILGDPVPEPDRRLVETLARANLWLADLQAGTPPAEILTREKISAEHFRRRLKLALLSPRIQGLIVAGRQPADLTLSALVRRADLPMDWAAQERRLGIA